MPAENYPLYQFLTDHARQAFDIAKYLAENPGKSIAQASKFVTNRTWNPTELRTGLQTVTRIMVRQNLAGATEEAILATGMQTIETETALVAAGETALVARLASVGRFLGAIHVARQPL